MPIVPLTDEELLAVADLPGAEAKFTSEERRRLTRLRGTKPTSDRALSSLPTVGATAMSLAAGGKSNPAGMLLAALGGAGGEGYRQALEAWNGNWDQVPPDIQSQLTSILKEGVKQGGLEGMGRYVIGPLSRMIGRGIYRSALKPSAAVRNEFGAGNVVKTLVDEGVPITRSEAGTAKVDRLLSESGKDTANTIRAASKAGAQPIDITQEVLPATQRTMSKKAEDVAMSNTARGTVNKLRQRVVDSNPFPVGVNRAQAMKQAEQDLAISAYKAEARGAPVNAVATGVHEDLARGLREAIERRVPGIRAKNMRTQNLIGALKAITGAENRIANRDPIGMGDFLALGTGALGTAVAGPEGAAMGVLQEVLTRPEIASRLGIALDRVGRPMVTPQILRTVNEAVNQLSQ